MKVIYAFALFAAFAFVLYGWGWALRKLIKAEIRSWPSTAASGMAAVVFLGGILNIARLAHPWALALVALAGAGLGLLAIASDKRPQISPLSFLIPGIPASIVLAFVAITQVPPAAYNFHDDYQKYFVHPVRMLETGTVVGSPLNDIGLDTIGGQAFLDGFVVAFFPIRYINAMGAAFALVLCMLLASEFTRGRRDLILMSLVCALSVVYINPQYVNISALYTGSLLMMAVVEDEGSSPAVNGLLCAALLALKSTFALFVVLHLAATLLVRGAKWASRAAVASALFFLPWLLLHATHYASIFHPNPSIADSGVRWQETFDMFSAEPLDYGSTPRNYTTLMLAIGVCGMLIAWARRKVDVAAASCFAALAAYFIMIYVSGPRNAGYSQAVRYFAPFAIAAAPAAFGPAGVAFLDVFFDGAKPTSEWLRIAIPLLIATIPVLAFTPSLRDRTKQALDSGSVLAFNWLARTPEYLEYNRQVLYGDMRQRVATAQAAVPAGEEAVAWINAPFYLDFKRNPIADVEPGAGLIAPWSRMPDAHYFIYEYAGYATVDPDDYREEMAENPDMMRRVGAARLNMAEKLDAIMKRSQKLYDDGQIAVFHE